MTRLLSVLAVLLVFTASGFVAEDAHAKKFGGSRSFGKTFKTAPAQPQKLTAPATGNNNNKFNSQNQQSGKKRGMLGGILGGLLAGGLLASLFGMGGFEGFQFMDILIVALIAFVAFKFFRNMGRAKAAAMGGGHTGYSQNLHRNQEASSPRDAGFDMRQQDQSPDNQHHNNSYQDSGYQNSGFQSDTLPGNGFQNDSDVPFNLPAGFDLNGFLNQARAHYRTVQEAWNTGDMTKIEEYLSPDLFVHMKREREALQGDQHTEVLYVDAEIVRADALFGKAEVSVRFKGRYRDNVERVEESITDIWHLERDMNQPNAPWLIVGLEYAED